MSELFPYCCARCHAEQVCADNQPWWAIHSVMYVCPDCGNKRCPKATDHRVECTHSNEPGQVGPAYE